MILSRTIPRLRALTRQQRALSAAPQPVYEPHVARSRVVIKKLKPAGTPLLRDVESGEPPFTPPPRRQNSSTLSDASAATPEQLDAAAATPE